MNLTYQLDPSGALEFHGRVTSMDVLNEFMAVAIAREITEQIASGVVKEKSAEIIARIDFDKIASMVIAEIVSKVASRIKLAE